MKFGKVFFMFLFSVCFLVLFSLFFCPAQNLEKYKRRMRVLRQLIV